MNPERSASLVESPANGQDTGLRQLRHDIDTIDTQLLALINRRLQLAMAMGALKAQQRLPVLDKKRECEVLERMRTSNRGPLSSTALHALFNALLAESRRLQSSEMPEIENVEAATTLFAVIGDPVVHSLGPRMHGMAFALTGYNGAYLALRVTDVPAAVAGIRALGLRGVSVTLPHKVEVMGLLDDVEAEARHIGAVNTISLEEGRLIGSNTDAPGLLRAISEHAVVQDREALILGAGGVARAAGYAMAGAGARITIASRRPDPGKELAAALGGQYRPLAKTDPGRYDIIINGTSVGMAGMAEAPLPIPAEALNPRTLVMDTVYTPLWTPLLKAAARVGCPVVDGAAMFIHQGVLQFERWTGLTAPLEAMRRLVYSALGQP